MSGTHFPRGSVNEYSGLLKKIMSREQMAGLLNCLVGIGANPRISDREEQLGFALFLRLMAECPDSVILAREQ